MQTIVSGYCMLCHFMIKIIMMFWLCCFVLFRVVSCNGAQKDGVKDGAEWRGE